jgi:hypothetical protein
MGFEYNATRYGDLVEEQSMCILRMICEVCMTRETVALERDGVPPPKGGRWWNTQTIRDIIPGDCYRPHTFEEIRQLVNLEVAARLGTDNSYSHFRRRSCARRMLRG